MPGLGSNLQADSICLVGAGLAREGRDADCLLDLANLFAGKPGSNGYL